MQVLVCPTSTEPIKYIIIVVHGHPTKNQLSDITYNYNYHSLL